MLTWDSDITATKIVSEVSLPTKGHKLGICMKITGRFGICTNIWQVRMHNCTPSEQLQKYIRLAKLPFAHLTPDWSGDCPTKLRWYREFNGAITALRYVLGVI